MTISTILEKNNECLNNKETKNNDDVVFIHASDIHLGSHQYRNEYRANDFINAFREILNKAIYHQADFILLAGDVFTSLEMLPGNLTQIVKILSEFKDYNQQKILLIAIEGNHDIRKFSRGFRFSKRGQSWLKLLSHLGLIILLDGNMEATPDSIYLPYKSKLKGGGKIQIKDVVVYGNRYIGENPEDYIPRIVNAINRKNGKFNILLQHFGIKGQMQGVPGIKFNKLYPLKEKVDYLALGHYHLQYIIDDWIYNPGSSEIVCSIDSNFNRGVFLVKVKRDKGFTKQVYSIKLKNRDHIWRTIHIPYSFKKHQDLIDYIILKLKKTIKGKKKNYKFSDRRIPILYLVLKGVRPFQNRKINEIELRAKILEHLAVIDVKIYQKLSNPIRSLNQFIYPT